MNSTPFDDLHVLAAHLRTELTTKKFVLLYAFRQRSKANPAPAPATPGKAKALKETQPTSSAKPPAP